MYMYLLFLEGNLYQAIFCILEHKSPNCCTCLYCLYVSTFYSDYKLTLSESFSINFAEHAFNDRN